MTYPSNEPDDGPTVAAEELLAFVERVEQLEAEKRIIAGDIKEFYAEVKGRGYDTRVLRKLIALRRRDPEDVAEEASVMDLYKAAIGMP